MTIGDNIKKIRKEKGLTQVQLAEKANISRSYLADVERNRYNPSISTLKSIASALEINVNRLLNENEKNATVEDNKEFDEDMRRIERARNKMTPKDKKKMMEILKLSFEDYFNDNN